jgi:hypothetical protein
MSKRQDLTTYTETDIISDRLTVTSDKVTVSNLDTDETVYLYKDFTASYFASDFEHSFEFTCAGSTGDAYIWAVTNTVDAIGAVLATPTNPILAICYDSANRYLVLVEGDGTNVDTTSGTVALTDGTTYYIRVCRDESTGTHGTLYAYIYADASCCTLVETITHTLEAKTDFRYLFAFSGAGNGAGNVYWTGSVNSLTLESHPYTLQNMVTTIRYYLREATASFWSDTEIKALINRAIRDIAERTGCIQHIDSVSTTGGVRDVSCTGYRTVAVEYIPASGRGRYLKLITPTMSGHVFIGLNGEPEYWFEEDNGIGIEPVPDAAYSLRLYVADYPAGDLTANTQVPEIPPAFRQLIIWYAAYVALIKDKKFTLAVFLYSIISADLVFNTMDKIVNVPVGLKNLKVE